MITLCLAVADEVRDLTQGFGDTFGEIEVGLPAEMQAEKELGIAGRINITNFGMDKFNHYCQSSVMQYAQQWEGYVARQG